MKILTHQLIMTYVGYIMNINIKESDNPEYNININKSNCVDLFLNNIVKIFFKPKFTGDRSSDKLGLLADLIEKTVVHTKKGRKYDMVRKSPVSKWCYSGHTFGQKKGKDKKKSTKKSTKKAIDWEKYITFETVIKNIDNWCTSNDNNNNTNILRKKSIASNLTKK